MHPFTLLALLALLSPLAEAAPPPGHPSTDRAAELMGLPAESTLRHQGRVLQALDSNDYTYLEVVTPAGERLWLAAPRLDVAPEAVIRFGEGVAMNDFYSKRLKRTFPRVLFVSGVAVSNAAP